MGLFEQNAGAKKILVVVGMSYQFLIDIQRFSIAKLAKSFCDDDLKKNNVKSYVSLWCLDWIFLLFLYLFNSKWPIVQVQQVPRHGLDY